MLFLQEVAELAHKVHLLCLLARGRVVDRACDDLLIQVDFCTIFCCIKIDQIIYILFWLLD